MKKFMTAIDTNHEESAVADAASRGDDLTATAVDGLVGDGSIKQLELDIANRLIAERTLAEHNRSFEVSQKLSQANRAAHWKPWTMESLMVPRRRLSTSEGSVSSTRMLGPVVVGPNAQMEREASTSQSYFARKNSPIFFVGQSILTAYLVVG